MESWFLSDYEGEYCRKSRHLLFLISWTRKQYVVSCTEFIVPFYFHVLGGRWWNLLGMSRNKYASHPIYSYKVKVKCTLVQALRLCIGSTAHRGSRGIALLFHVHGTRRGWGVSVTPRPLFSPWKDPVPIVQEAGWAPAPVWTGAENLAPHRDSIHRPSSP